MGVEMTDKEQRDVKPQREKQPYDDMLVMDLKKSNDVTIWHIIFIMTAIVNGIAGVVLGEILILTCLTLPFLAMSGILELYLRGRSIIVTDDGIENVYFFIFAVRVPWECIRGYRQKIKRGEYVINTSWKSDTLGGWSEDEYKIKLYYGKITHVTVSNSFTEYKKFKKLVKEKEIPKLKEKSRRKNNA